VATRSWRHANGGDLRASKGALALLAGSGLLFLSRGCTDPGRSAGRHLHLDPGRLRSDVVAIRGGAAPPTTCARLLALRGHAFAGPGLWASAPGPSGSVSRQVTCLRLVGRRRHGQHPEAFMNLLVVGYLRAASRSSGAGWLTPADVLRPPLVRREYTDPVVVDRHNASRMQGGLRGGRARFYARCRAGAWCAGCSRSKRPTGRNHRLRTPHEGAVVSGDQSVGKVRPRHRDAVVTGLRDLRYLADALRTRLAADQGALRSPYTGLFFAAGPIGQASPPQPASGSLPRSDAAWWASDR
jgi:hypothetical protein